MVAVAILAAVTCIGMMVSVLCKPTVCIGGHTIGLYWLITLTGAALTLLCRLLSPAELMEKLTQDSAVNPLKILVLFISVTVLSVFLDEVGFFRYLANAAVRYAGGNQKTLFVILYLTVSVLTVFTSNDIVILTFTPFICYFAKSAGIRPAPYLVSEFVAANTWSMLLMIGNPTNIYLAGANGINFVAYLRVMWLPAILAGCTAFAVLFFLFRRSLSVRFSAVGATLKIPDKPLLAIGLFHLGACTLLLAFSSFLKLPMWAITLGFAVSLFITVTVCQLIRHRRPRELAQCAKRAPWSLVPFVLSMFVLVMALEKHGVTAAVGKLLGQGDYTVLQYGIASTLTANLINNIPMSVFFSSVLSSLPSANLSAGVYATVIGSNIGAFLTPVGALAGIMWSNILKTQGVRFPLWKFVLYGVAVAVPVLAASLLGLCLTI